MNTANVDLQNRRNAMTEKEIETRWRKAHWKFFTFTIGIGLLGLLSAIILEEVLPILISITFFNIGWYSSTFEHYDEFKKRLELESNK